MLIHEILSSLDIRLLAFGKIRSGHEWNYRGVNNYYNRLILIQDGTTTVTHHGLEYQLSAGSIHLIPCYTSADYVCSSSTGFNQYYLHFTSRAFGGLDICKIQEYDYQRKARELDYSFFEQLHRLNPQRELPALDPSVHLYRLHHDELQEKYHTMPPHLYLENMAYISLILAPFLATGTTASTSRSESKRLYTFAAYVEKNLHRSFNIKEIADALDLSPNYLSDWLFKLLKVRPTEYINRRRIEEAQQLLISSEKSIKEIAHQLGFTSSTYFARVFKDQLGISATRYRALYI